MVGVGLVLGGCGRTWRVRIRAADHRPGLGRRIGQCRVRRTGGLGGGGGAPGPRRTGRHVGPGGTGHAGCGRIVGRPRRCARPGWRNGWSGRTGAWTRVGVDGGLPRPVPWFAPDLVRRPERLNLPLRYRRHLTWSMPLLRMVVHHSPPPPPARGYVGRSASAGQRGPGQLRAAAHRSNTAHTPGSIHHDRLRFSSPATPSSR